MNYKIYLVLFLAVLFIFSACTSTPSGAEDPNFVALDKPVDGNSGNNLAATIGTVTVVVDQDMSYEPARDLSGATLEMCEYLGVEALHITKSSKGEIRVAFVFDEITSLTGYTTLSYDILGINGSGGVYNCGLLYTDLKNGGERIGSFYVSNISKSEWTHIELDLSSDENWGENFNEDRELYCIQFWTNQGSDLYITNLQLQ